MQKIRKPVLIKGIGSAYGRDAIFLDKLAFEQTRKVILIGEFNRSLCSEVNQNKYIQYQLTFAGVLHFQSTELDFYEANN